MINYDLPIFAFYINVDNMSRQGADILLEQLRKSLIEKGIIDNSFILMVENQESKIEVLWKGKYENSQNSDIFKKKIENILEIVEGHISDQGLKQRLRNVIIKDLID